MKDAKKVIRVHKKLDFKNEKERDAQKLLDYLTKHYNEPDISVATVAKATNLSPYTIPTLIQQDTKLSFKQLINKLRITQAKTLLIESDSKIIDIAYAIGYNTVTHFNKIFKNLEGVSPKEYRKKNSSK